MHRDQFNVEKIGSPKEYMRPKAACAHFRISRSTLWNWVNHRPGFPQPFKASARVVLFDKHEIETYLRSHQNDSGQ